MTLVLSLVVGERDMITTKSKFVIVGAATLVLGAGTGIAAAAIRTSPSPVDSSGTIHGCWANRAVNGSHVLVLQDGGTRCPKGTTAISWNEEGRPGPPGPSGQAGQPGASSGVSSLDQLNGIPCDHGAGTTSLSYGSNGDVSIRCITPTMIATPTVTVTATPTFPPTTAVPPTPSVTATVTSPPTTAAPTTAPPTVTVTVTASPSSSPTSAAA
jgi:hypothetical protein